MKTKILLAALVMTLTGLAMAQTTATPALDQRLAHQQGRIDQGVASGQLNARETHRLDKREAKLASDVSAAKADGKVTRAERRKLRREANRNSRAIYKLKHNNKTAAAG